MIRRLLNIEGFISFLVSAYFYSFLHGNWIIFILLLFVPDIFMVGYFINKKLGAFIYNISHTYITSFLLIATGIFLENNLLILGGLILTAHIGMDRTIGYGLKYSSNFKDTHLQKV